MTSWDKMVELRMTLEEQRKRADEEAKRQSVKAEFCKVCGKPAKAHKCVKINPQHRGM